MGTALMSESWTTLRIRPDVREILEQISQMNHNSKIRFILLFGSEARGEALLTSDVDLALVSTEPLTRAERLEFAKIFDDIAFPDFNIINTLMSDMDTNKFTDVNYHLWQEGLVIYAQ